MKVSFELFLAFLMKREVARSEETTDFQKASIRHVVDKREEVNGWTGSAIAAWQHYRSENIQSAQSGTSKRRQVPAGSHQVEVGREADLTGSRVQSSDSDRARGMRYMHGRDSHG